ncbi:MAG: hypothetical protein J0I06_00620 [Planctomycetes bacterium]|nr:hypothetical protein [Planctomycetota bacterium]
MAKQQPAPATHFVVSRLTWRVAGWDRVFVRLPGETRVAAFADRPAAEADRADRESAARKVVNPFRCGSNWGERSHLPEPVFRDFIRDVGIEPPVLVPLSETDEKGNHLSRYARMALREQAPPAGTFRDWGAWWDATAPALSAEQVARVWEGLDRVQFFRVDERPVRPVGFVVVEVRWQYNDEWFYPPPEGGGPHTAYRSRERAEAECARMNADAREEWRRRLNLPAATAPVVDRAGHEAFPFDMQGRTFPGDDPFGPRREPPRRANEEGIVERGLFAVDEVPFYEVIEFELERP